MISKFASLVAAGSCAVLAGSTFGAISIAQTTAPAPTYSNLITFDGPGAPTGLLPNTTWASQGITITDGVNGPNVVVDNFSGTFPWINSENAADGNFGLNLT